MARHWSCRPGSSKGGVKESDRRPTTASPAIFWPWAGQYGHSSNSSGDKSLVTIRRSNSIESTASLAWLSRKCLRNLLRVGQQPGQSTCRRESWESCCAKLIFLHPPENVAARNAPNPVPHWPRRK